MKTSCAKASLTAQLADQPEPPALRLHPSMAARYSEEAERLSAALYDEGLMFEASNILTSLIDEIRTIPDPTTPAKHEIELIGDLAGILHLMDANNKRPPAKLGGSIASKLDLLVAGERSWIFYGLYRGGIVKCPDNPAISCTNRDFMTLHSVRDKFTLTAVRKPQVGAVAQIILWMKCA